MPITGPVIRGDAGCASACSQESLDGTLTTDDANTHKKRSTDEVNSALWPCVEPVCVRAFSMVIPRCPPPAAPDRPPPLRTCLSHFWRRPWAPEELMSGGGAGGAGGGEWWDPVVDSFCLTARELTAVLENSGLPSHQVEVRSMQGSDYERRGARREARPDGRGVGAGHEARAAIPVQGRVIMVLCDNVHYRVILGTGCAHYLFDSLGLYEPVHRKVWPHTGNHGPLLHIPLTPQGDAHSCGVWVVWALRVFREYPTDSQEPLPDFFERRALETGVSPSSSAANNRMICDLKRSLRSDTIPVPVSDPAVTLSRLRALGAAPTTPPTSLRPPVQRRGGAVAGPPPLPPPRSGVGGPAPRGAGRAPRAQSGRGGQGPTPVALPPAPR